MSSPVSWTYSNWRTVGPIGSALRVSTLAKHIQEIADRISQVQEYAIKGRQVGPPVSELRQMMADLDMIYEREAERADIASGARIGYTQGFAKLTPGTVPGGEENT